MRYKADNTFLEEMLKKMKERDDERKYKRNRGDRRGCRGMVGL